MAIDPTVTRPALAYSIGTLVTDPLQYEAMRRSFEGCGFKPADCEFLRIDNTGPEQTDAYRGLNQLLDRARGRHVVLCHQDVRLIRDGRSELDQRLAELDRLDPAWALAGNAGGVAAGRLAMRITDPHGRDRSIGRLPARVASLDENLIIVRRDARIGFSRDLAGFHFYGADICLAADVMGYTAYVIDFHLEHLSAGRKSDDFYASEAAFRRKWSRAFGPRWIQTTCSLVRLSGNPLGRGIGPALERPVRMLARRLSSASGWNGGVGELR